MPNNHKPKSSAAKPSFEKEAISDFDKGAQLLIESLQELVMMAAMGFGELIKLCYKHYTLTIGFFASLFVFTRYFAKNAYHVDALVGAFPEFFTSDRVEWFYRFSLNQHHLVLFALCISSISVALGFQLRFTRTKFKRIFLVAGLSNGEGDTPKLVFRRRLDKYRTEYDFDANGVGISEFEDRRERIEARFKMEIESIKYGKHQGRILITFNKRKFPERITYAEVSEEKILSPDSFYVGYSMEGVVVQKISDLPHMIVAGTTGSGKSVFFKQCLLGLLESCPSLQLYIIDLKGGLEAIDFKEAPNVKIVKDISKAVLLLREVDKEMKARFNFLEENGLKTIIPGRDKMERIVVAVDEASVLYMKRSRYDDDYAAAMEARKLADSISKLSRAASIHLILATQKLDKQVIPTSVSENISGRMAFRANSLQGSMVVLGNKDASDLPEIPGRGIWNVGNKQVIVQTPFIQESEIKNYCKRIKNEFKAGKRKRFNPMIGIESLKTEQAKQTEIYKLIKKEDANETDE